MKQIIAVILLASAVYAPAAALEIRLPIARPSYTCAAGALSRVALHTDPAPCCTGQLGCPQLLANTGLIKPRRSPRT